MTFKDSYAYYYSKIYDYNDNERFNLTSGRINLQEKEELIKNSSSKQQGSISVLLSISSLIQLIIVLEHYLVCPFRYFFVVFL